MGLYILDLLISQHFFFLLYNIIGQYLTVTDFLLNFQITLPYDTKELSKATRDTAAIYLACGIDASKVLQLLILDNAACSVV